MMRSFKKCFVLAVAILLTGNYCYSQTIPFDSDRWEFTGETRVENYLGKESLHLAAGGTAVIKDSEFTDGTIEFDVVIPQGRGFPGAMWRLQDSQNYEEFYMRAHQSGNPDANQYTPVYNALPAWQLYYGERFSTPTRYAFGEWFHVRIAVSGKYADIYIADMDNPALSVELLRDTKAGRIGLKAGVIELETHFANFSFTTDTPVLKGIPKAPGDTPGGTVMSWSVSETFDEKSLDGKFTLAESDKDLTWTTLSCDRTGLANLARVQGLGEGKDTVYARLNISSDKDQVKKLRFGFSDRIKAFFNDRLLYIGNDLYRTRFLGTIGFYDELYLPLEKGENELLMAVSESFGGWGVQAMFEDMKGIAVIGTVRVNEKGGVRIHTYLSDALQATYIIESANSLVLVDAQFTAPFAREFRSYADGLGKPVERVIISHGHPDHFFGLGAAFDDMSDKIYALAATKEFIETVGPGMLENMKLRLGDAAPDKIVVPTQVIEPGTETIDGVRYEFVRYENGETSEQLVIRLPDLNTLIVQDLAFNGLHLYMGNNTLDGWTAILESLQGLGGYDTVLCGHGEPGGMSVIAANIAYLKDVMEIIGKVDNAEDFKTQLLAKYPDLGATNYIDMSAPALFPGR